MFEISKRLRAEAVKPKSGWEFHAIENACLHSGNAIELEARKMSIYLWQR